MIIIMSGIQASGKTTLALKLRNELLNRGKRVIYISSDDTRKELTGTYEFGIDEESVWSKVNFRLSESIKDNSNFVIFDATNLDKSRRKNLFSLIDNNNDKCIKICVYIKISLKTALIRNSQRGKRVDRIVIKNYYRKKSIPKAKESKNLKILIVGGEKNLDQNIEKILNFLSKQINKDY